MAALPVVLRVGWFRRRCGVGGDAGVAGHHGCVQKITEDAMRPLAEFTRSPCRAHFVPRRAIDTVERPEALLAASPRSDGYCSPGPPCGRPGVATFTRTRPICPCSGGGLESVSAVVMQQRNMWGLVR